MSVADRGLRRSMISALEIVKNHPIIVDVGSYHKPEYEHGISLWNACRLEKTEDAVRMG
jgi:hypothetical protein